MPWLACEVSYYRRTVRELSEGDLAEHRPHRGRMRCAVRRKYSVPDVRHRACAGTAKAVSRRLRVHQRRCAVRAPIGADGSTICAFAVTSHP